MGCSTSTGTSPAFTSASEVIKGLWPGEAALKTPLTTQYRTIHVELNGQTATLVLGHEETVAAKRVQVWYGADGLALKTSSEGRLLGVWGLGTEWTLLRLVDAPSFDPVQNPVQFRRIRSEMPGYRVNITEAVTLRRLNNAPSEIRSDFKAKKLQWYEELSTVVGDPRRPSLEAFYGFQQNMTSHQLAWVYSYQCLREDLCLSWFQDVKP